MASPSTSVDALRVVVLAGTAEGLPYDPPWPGDEVTVRAKGWCLDGDPPDHGVSWPMAWHRVAATPQGSKGRREAVRQVPRKAASALRNAALARRYDLSLHSISALKADRSLRAATHRADVLLCGDEVADRILRALPDLARGAVVFDSTCALPSGREWSQLRRWLAHIDAAAESASSVIGDNSTHPAAVLLPAVARHIEFAGLRCAERWSTEESLVRIQALQRIEADLGLPSTLQASEAFAAMWQGAPLQSDSEYLSMSQTAVDRADHAWARGDRTLALYRLHSAIVVSLHRARHAETSTSPLVDDPAALLASLHQSRAYQDLTRPRRRHAVRRTPGRRRRASIGPQQPTVMVLPGAYGEFHHDMLEALTGRATVRVAKTLRRVAFRRRRLHGADLVLLNALRNGEVDVEQGVWDGCPAGVDVGRQMAALSALHKELDGVDVVVGDWIDASTMWASHLLPAQARMVVRTHSLDILDPWLHFVDWDAVKVVMTPHSAFAGLLSEITADLGAPQPQVMLPYRPDLERDAPRRHPEARFTLGMTGWGREVKDPHVALDLLERDERRRLVLIGPGFPEAGPGLIQPYARSFERRLEEPQFKDRVHIVGRTDDVHSHLAQIGIMLSTSVREGWHLGLIEGAASGAVPVVRDWSLLAGRGGSRSVFPPEWVVDSIDEADARISLMSSEQVWNRESLRARDMALARFASEPIGRAYRKAILGGT